MVVSTLSRPVYGPARTEGHRRAGLTAVGPRLRRAELRRGRRRGKGLDKEKMREPSSGESPRLMPLKPERGGRGRLSQGELVKSGVGVDPVNESSSNPEPLKLLVRCARFPWGNPTNGSFSKLPCTRPPTLPIEDVLPSRSSGPCAARAHHGSVTFPEAHRPRMARDADENTGTARPALAPDWARDKNIRQALCPRLRMARAADEKTGTARPASRALAPNDERHEETRPPCAVPSPRWRGAASLQRDRGAVSTAPTRTCDHVHEPHLPWRRSFRTAPLTLAEAVSAKDKLGPARSLPRRGWLEGARTERWMSRAVAPPLPGRCPKKDDGRTFMPSMLTPGGTKEDQ